MAALSRQILRNDIFKNFDRWPQSGCASSHSKGRLRRAIHHEKHRRNASHCRRNRELKPPALSKVATEKAPLDGQGQKNVSARIHAQAKIRQLRKTSDKAQQSRRAFRFDIGIDRGRNADRPRTAVGREVSCHVHLHRFRAAPRTSPAPGGRETTRKAAPRRSRASVFGTRQRRRLRRNSKGAASAVLSDLVASQRKRSGILNEIQRCLGEGRPAFALTWTFVRTVHIAVDG